MSITLLRRPTATFASVAILATTAVGIAFGVSACGGFGSGALDGGRVSTIGEVSFMRPLAIPPLAESRVDEVGTRVFDLFAEAGESEFGAAPAATSATTTLGYSTPARPDSYLGPTLVARAGEKVRIDVHNRLAETTTFHLHGMHLPAAMDGGPHQPIAPGADWSAEWTVSQAAATLWYHPHPHGASEGQVARGLAGMVILQDEEESALALPREYGVDDIPVIVQDATFDPTGQFRTDNRGFVGSLGDTLLVNGTVGPYLTVDTETVRLRLLNASTARIYDFGFDDDRGFEQVAGDGGLLWKPYRTNRVQLSPGERAEIVVRFAAGERAILRSTPPDLGTPDGLSSRNGGADSFDVLELRASTELAESPGLPSTLGSASDLAESDVTAIRDLRLEGFEINGEQMDLSRIDQVVESGATELWTVKNDMSLPHNLHIHDVQFRVLSIDGVAPPPGLAGPKDTIYLRPQAEYRLLMRFDDYTDPALPYMYHCHLLWHEDQGMMGQFVVVAPGQGAGTIQGDNHDH